MLIDAHTHMPSPGMEIYAPVNDTVEKAVRYLRDAGTDAAIFTPWRAVFAESAEDLQEGNAQALALAKEYDGFLYPGATIHPAFPELSLEWLARFRDLGYKWVGELVQYKLPYQYTDPEFLRLAEVCAEHGHILQSHIDVELIELARRFPELPVVNSHIDKALSPQQAEVPNLWLDLSGGAGGLHIGAMEAAFQAFGPDRLLFGTDFTGYEPRAFQVRLEAAVPEPAAREQIRWKNVARLLERMGSRPIC
ncbi:MAG: amidohydrolase family protein [Armatimonadota bacterium]